uniref:Uncharacterized protein n=1 Tax=Gopherus agassizii TaxID=38772 RepID=A0A452GVW2_9SAUR
MFGHCAGNLTPNATILTLVEYQSLFHLCTVVYRCLFINPVFCAISVLTCFFSFCTHFALGLISCLALYRMAGSITHFMLLYLFFLEWSDSELGSQNSLGIFNYFFWGL